MEKARKNLKEMSVLILIFAVFSFVRSIVEILFAGLSIKDLPEEITENIVIIGIVVLCAFSLILSIPQLYVGIRGIKVAKKPVATKGHIVWAIILAVISALCVISSVRSIIQTGFSISGALELADMVIDVLIFAFYVKYANQVQQAATHSNISE